MRGGSAWPWRVELEATRGAGPVERLVKWRGAAQGEAALVAEFTVNRIASVWGAHVPRAEAVDLPAGLERAGTDEFWDVLEASVGPNLALAWIEGRELPAQAASFEDPSMDALTRACITAIDTCFENRDRRVANPNLMREGSGQIWLIDHGGCTFDPREPPRFGWPKGHAFERRAIIPMLGDWRPPPLDARALRDLLRDLPAAWLRPLGWTRVAWADALARRLEAFAAWIEGPAPDRIRSD